MKYLITLFLTVGLVTTSCKKEIINPTTNKPIITTLQVDQSPFPLESSNIYLINSFEGYNCDTFTTSPVMVSICVFWEGGDQTTVGVFSWEIDNLTMCPDGILVSSNEVFMYIHSGVGQIIDYSYQTIYPSSEVYVDTVSISYIYGESYSDVDNSVIRFYSLVGRPFKIKITDITIENIDKN
jgi:hypothetical protein